LLNRKYFSQLLAGEKVAFKRKDIRTIELPAYQAFNVGVMATQFKNDPLVAQYFPDEW